MTTTLGWRASTRPRAQRHALLAAGLVWTLVVVAQAVWLPDQREAVDTLRDDTLRAQQQVRALQARAAGAPAGAAPRSPVEAFRAHFPAAADNAQRSARLLALARRHGLEATRAEFGHGVEPSLSLTRYRVTLPLQGRYGRLRAFVADALAADPALQLDALSLRRADVGAGALEAQLQFTLLSREDASVRGVSPAVAR
jgi:hypothetical protein